MSLSSIDPGLITGTAGWQRSMAEFGEAGTVEAYLEFERALARAQRRAGLVPEGAARAIGTTCRMDRLDLDRLRAGALTVGYPIVALVAEAASAVDALSVDAGRWVHFGATSQDVMDTALVLQIRRLRDPLLVSLDRSLTHLGALAQTHMGAVMSGRSKLQHAAPVSFGYRAAVWLDQLRRCRDGLASTFDACAVVQFGGAVGTLAALGRQGLAVRALLAEELALAEPAITWHVSRDRFAALVQALALTCAGLGKIALDTSQLMATEIAELREPYAPGRGSSSTMPQKRNPVLCEAILEAARETRQAPAKMLEAMLQDHERATGLCYLERRAVADTLAQAAGAADLTADLLAGLQVDAARMRTNIDLTGGLMMAEAAMIVLADRLGRHEAHHLVQDACRRAEAEGRPLLDLLQEDLPELRDDLAGAFAPESYLGAQEDMIGRVLGRTG